MSALGEQTWERGNHTAEKGFLQQKEFACSPLSYLTKTLLRSKILYTVSSAHVKG